MLTLIVRLLPILFLSLAAYNHASAQSVAYIPQATSGSYLSKFDLKQQSQVAGVALPTVQNALAVAVSQNGQTAYVACVLPGLSGVVEVIDLALGSVTESIALSGDGVTSMALSPDGTKLIVLEEFEASSPANVDLVDLTQGKVVKSYPLGQGYRPGVVIPAGQVAYVNVYYQSLQAEPESAQNELLEVNYQTAQIAEVTFRLPTPAQYIALSPDKQTAYLAAMNSTGIDVLNISTLTAGASIGIGILPCAGLAVSPDGSKVYSISNDDSMQNAPNVLQVVSAETGDILNTVTLPGDPSAVAATPDGSTILVATFATSTLLTLDASSLSVTQQVPLGDRPDAIAIAPGGSEAFVTNYGASTIQRIDVTTREFLRSAEADSSSGLAVGGESPVLFSLEGFNHGPYVDAISLKTGLPLASIPISVPASGLTSTVYLASSAQGNQIFASTNGGPTNSTLSEFAYPGGKLLNTVLLPGGAGPALVSPDGTQVYISGISSASAGASELMVVDVSTFQVVKALPLNVYAGALAFDAQRRLLYFGYTPATKSLTSNGLGKLDLSSGTLTTIPIGPVAAFIGQVVLSANGEKAYVPNPKTGQLAIVNTQSQQLITTISMPSPVALALNPNGSEVWVLSQTGANGAFTSQQIEIVSTTSDQVTGTIPVSNFSGPSLVIR